MGGPRHVRLDMDQTGHGLVEVGGIDVRSVIKRVTVDTNAGQPNKVYLEAANGHSLEAEFDAFVFDHAVGSDDVLRFLQNVDVAALEAAAMEKLNGIDGILDNPMAAALVVLQEWAQDGNDNGT